MKFALSLTYFYGGFKNLPLKGKNNTPGSRTCQDLDLDHTVGNVELVTYFNYCGFVKNTYRDKKHLHKNVNQCTIVFIFKCKYRKKSQFMKQ